MRFENFNQHAQAMHLKGVHHADGVKPLDVAKSIKLSTAAANVVLVCRLRRWPRFFRPVAAVSRWATQIPHVWSMAREAAKFMPKARNNPPEITLVQNFLKAEISPKFELVELLDHGVGVHHAGLSDETRALMEWLTEEGSIWLCSVLPKMTIAQGINFPV